VLFSRNLGTLTSWNPLGHSRPVTGLLYLNAGGREKLYTNPRRPSLVANYLLVVDE
jgi:hypothetical protein